MRTPRRRGGVEFGGIGPDLLADPLAFLTAEHARQGALLGHLERLARHPDAPGSRALAGALAAWLVDDLPRHMADEERSLHRRLLPFDEAGILRRLAADHETERRGIEMLVEGLRAIAGHQPLPAGFAAIALGFAAAFREHLDVEETEVTPLARRVLPPTVLAEIAAEMAERRSRHDAP